MFNSKLNFLFFMSNIQYIYRTIHFFFSLFEKNINIRIDVMNSFFCYETESLYR